MGMFCKECRSYNVEPIGGTKVHCSNCGCFQEVDELLDLPLSRKERVRGFELVSYDQWLKSVAVYDLWESKAKEGDGSVIGISKYEDIVLPKRATAHSAGYDIFSTLSFILKPNENILIPTGFKAYMEKDERVTIYPRSGLGFKYFIRLANTTGIVDSDYYNNESNEGHFFVKLRNEGDKILEIKKGEAIAQCMFEKFLLADGDTFEGEKRKGGFGSTG